jgi:hypothetical protein
MASISAKTAGENVIALPPRPSENGAIIGASTWPIPSVEAIGIGPSICAASK